MKRTNIWLTEKQLKWLRRKSKSEGITQAELVRRAIDGYIKVEKE